MSITALHLHHERALTAFEQDFVSAGEARVQAYFADFSWPHARHELTDALREVGGHIGYSVRPSARRQGFGTAVMRGGLDVCRDLGITEALVTCDETNVGSIGVIRNNGGRLFDTDARPGQPAICRFWVPVSA